MSELVLTEAEEDHLNDFKSERPDWRLIVLVKRIFDEGEGEREHKYQRSHPYITGMKYVLDKIVPLAPCSVLDIGSPIAQNVALGCVPGVKVTVVDVRPNQESGELGLAWKQASATKLPYPDASMDIVTSMWVMGHVGDGRYGDDFRVNGDTDMLAEIARVLRPGGTAIIGPGLVAEKDGSIFNLHRIYSWPWLRQEFARVGLEVLETRELPVSAEWYIADAGVAKKDGAYGVALLRKT